MSNATTSNPGAAQGLSNAKFLQWLFGPKAWGQAHVCGFKGDPLATEHRKEVWQGDWARDMLSQLTADMNAYYCVSLFSGHVRQKPFFQALHVLGLDDVGTKVSAQHALDLLGEPSYRIETSPGSEQWGYRLAPPLTDCARADRMQTRLVDVLIGQVRAPDPGQKGVARYMRLPVGRNLKASLGLGAEGFACHGTGGTGRSVPTDDIEAKVDAAWMKLAGATTSTTSCSTSHGAGDTGQRDTGTPGDEDILPVYDPLEIDAGDYLLGALHDLGKVKSGPRAMAGGTGWDIECPWIDEHTNHGATGTAYFRGGGFRCHHGHCQHRGPMDLWEGVNALLDQDSAGLDSLEQRAFGPGTWPPGVTLKKPLKASPPGTAFAQALAEAHVYMATEDAIARRRSGRAVSLPAFDRAWGDKLGPYGADVLPVLDTGRTKRRLRASEWYLRHPARQDVLGAAWAPGVGEVVPDPTDPDVYLLNTWRPWPRALEGMGGVTEAQVAPWLALVDHVFPVGHGTVDDPTGSLRELILDWMALMLGAPAVKPGWHVLLTGGQGIGKDMVMDPLRRLMHGSVSMIGSHDLGSQFTGWAKARLVLGQEIKQTGPGTTTGHDQYGKLKQFTSNSEQWLDINGKYQRRETVANVCGLWLTSNETVPLPIERDDRRFLVFASPATPWPGHDYAALGTWLVNAGGADLVGEFLWQRWETMPVARRHALEAQAPMTSSRTDLARASGGPVNEWIEDIMARAAPPSDPQGMPDVVTAQDMVDAMARALRHGGQGLPPGLRVPAARVMGSLIKGAGGRALNRGKQVRVRATGLVRVVWSLRDHATYWDMAPDQLNDVLEAQTKAATGVAYSP